MEKISFDATNTALDYEEVVANLKTLFIDNERNREKFHPLSKKRAKHPAREMRQMLETMGADFIKEPELHQMEYVFSLVTGYGEDFTYLRLTVDYWNNEVFTD